MFFDIFKHKKIFITVTLLCVASLLFLGSHIAAGLYGKADEQLQDGDKDDAGTDDENIITKKDFAPDYIPVSVKYKDPEGKSHKSKLMYKDGNFYAFLPSFAISDDLNLEYDKNKIKLSVKGKENDASSDDAERVLNDGDAVMSVDDGERVREGSVVLMQSENLPAVYMDTESGSMRSINYNKTVTERARLTWLSEKGHKELESDLSVHARGKSSFKLSEKKSYKLKLDKKQSLPGFDKSRDFILQANSFDPTNLRNALALQLADELSLECVSGYAWVDLFCNDEYMGNYLVLEPVDSVMPPLQDGDIEVAIDAKEEESYRFRTDCGLRLKALFPEGDDDLTHSLIESEANDKFGKIYDCAEGKLSLEELSGSVDIDSFVRMFLLDEITDEVDINSASTFFYEKDGQLFAGPPWDFDRAFGNETLRGRNASINGFTEGPCEMLYSNAEFGKLAAGVLGDDDHLLTEISEFIDRYSAYIRSSSEMDRAVYGGVDERFVEKGSYEKDVEYLKDFASKRYAVVKDVIQYPEEYCRVFVNDSRYRRVAWVRKGSHPDKKLIDDLCEIFDCDGLSLENGEPFDETICVTGDIEVMAPQEQ